MFQIICFKLLQSNPKIGVLQMKTIFITTQASEHLYYKQTVHKKIQDRVIFNFRSENSFYSGE